MAADNDLSEDAEVNIRQIEKAFLKTGTRIILFVDQYENTPFLYEISSKNKGIVKNYTELNSANSETMKMILLEIIQNYPSISYGLIL